MLMLICDMLCNTYVRIAVVGVSEGSIGHWAALTSAEVVTDLFHWVLGPSGRRES